MTRTSFESPDARESAERPAEPQIRIRPRIRWGRWRPATPPPWSIIAHPSDQGFLHAIASGAAHRGEKSLDEGAGRRLGGGVLRAIVISIRSERMADRQQPAKDGTAGFTGAGNAPGKR